MNQHPAYQNLPLILETLTIGRQPVHLFVPQTEAVKSAFTIVKEADQAASFPYWTKIWPSAIAMAEFLVSRPQICSGKLVIELAAGLGLPSLVASPVAKKVSCSDNQYPAVEAIGKSITYNRYENIEALVIDWNDLPEKIEGDVLLLSDISYDPVEFDQLKKIIENFLAGGRMVILSTPQRLVAKSFIGAISSHIRESWHSAIQQELDSIPVSVFVLV